MALVNINEVEWRKDLYPRFDPDQNLIQQYSNSLEYLPKIKINQNKILIDGYHRWKAHQLAKKDEIDVEIVETESEAALKIMAYRLNSHHGKQLSSDEKQQFAQQMVGIITIQEISGILSVSERVIRDWTVAQRAAQEKEELRKIINLYLHAENTQEMIAEMLEIERSIISRKINNFVQNGSFSELHKNSDFTPFLYNIWNLQKADKQTSHFGYFPQVFMENLFYYHTEPFDKIYDPFAGTGTTVDACKKWYRRYYCSDLNVMPGREDDIKQWDINNGLPDNLPKPELAFLDPPYWKQAEGKYSELPTDLGNMELDKFYETMKNLLSALKAKKCNKIAIVIQPTQYKNDMQWEDHIFKFHEMLCNKYSIIMRYILPYSTEQYLPQMVIKAKEEQICLGTHRDLIIWGLSHD